jgi:hypothetical protein
MNPVDRAAGFDLLQTGTVVEFNIAKTQIHEGPDGGEFSVEIELEFPLNPETDESDLDWGGFGFLFVIGTLSFADARPREASVLHYVERDEFTVGDFIQCLRWEGGELKFSADYVRGRRMKTDVVLRPNASGQLTTAGRGKAAILWLERLKGKKMMQVVQPPTGS